MTNPQITNSPIATSSNMANSTYQKSSVALGLSAFFETEGL